MFNTSLIPSSSPALFSGPHMVKKVQWKRSYGCGYMYLNTIRVTSRGGGGGGGGGGLESLLPPLKDTKLIHMQSNSCIPPYFFSALHFHTIFKMKH